MTTIKEAVAQKIAGDIYPRLPQTEFAVISLLLNHKENVDVVLANGLNIDSFFTEGCRKIFDVVVCLINEKGYISKDTVRDRLSLRSAMNPEIMNILMSNKNNHSDELPELCRVLKDYEKQRQLVSVAKEISNISYLDKTYNEKLNMSLSALETIKGEEENNIHYLQSSYDSVLEEIAFTMLNKGKNVITWGIDSLNRCLGGIQTGLHVVAARPGVGKTSFVDGLIDENAANGVVTLMISCEMNKKELVLRKIQRELGIDANRIRRGELTDEEYNRIKDFKAQLSDNVIICDASALEISKLKSLAKIKAKKDNVKMIVIDYLQLLKCHGKKNRYEEVTEISMQLKALSKELNVPVIALSQLNRNLANRSNGKPELADLRESGQIEQDADSVMFIHRPAMYDKSSPYKLTDGSEIAELIIAKNRFGDMRDVICQFVGKHVKFQELSHTTQEEVDKIFNQPPEDEEEKKSSKKKGFSF